MANRAETEQARSTAMAAGPDSGCREGKTAGLRNGIELLPQIQHERAETLCVQEPIRQIRVASTSEPRDESVAVSVKAIDLPHRRRW
jgi:hypothetical protein